MIIKLLVYVFAAISIMATIQFAFMIIDDVGDVPEEINRTIWETYNKCCEGKPCTDTYYDEEKDLCRSTMSLCSAWKLPGCSYDPSE